MHRTIISFLVTKAEANLLDRVAHLEPWLVETLRKARPSKDMLRIKLDDEELRDCLSALTYEAEYNHSFKFDLLALADKLEDYSKLKGLADQRKC